MSLLTRSFGHSLEQPNNIAALWAVIQLELERLFASRQGWFYLATFAFFWYLLLRLVIFNISSFISQQGVREHNWSDTIFSTYFGVGLYFFPLLCIFIASNQTGGDRERGTLRFILLRCSRDALFFGRFLSQVVIQLFLIMVTMLSVLITIFYVEGFSMQAIGVGLLMTTNMSLALLPFIAMMSLLSAVVKSPRQATIIAALIWSMATGVISLLSHYFPLLEPVKMIVPGMQFNALVDLEGMAMFSLAYISILQCVVLLAVGRYVMKRTAL